ncbi:HET-domain-containing protein [Apiospora marii]|uniref:HET-domain-containing protein n=1 Tax=Apiospora marii TaxID=335849 RepID=A0ABR1RQR3_9PEZI
MEAGSEEAPHSGSSTPQWASDCTICQDIWNLFSDPKSAPAVNLGSFPDALSTSCPAHKPLVQAFHSHVADCEDAETQDVGLVCGADGHSVEMAQSISHGGYVWHLLLVKDASVESHPGTGRILDPDWANLGMLKEWKHDCLALHGKLCDNPMKIWNTRPAWLIDVKQRCLVPGQVPDNFVALSYVYGSHRGSHMDADMLARLQQPMALDAPEAAQLLSPIVQHAMYLTGVIGELYLWVDALCIPHHDAEATKEQLVVRNTGMFSMSGELPYYDRGWTYQEYKMSPRRILFNRRELHWECSCSVWHEELVRGAEVDKYIDDRMKVILAGFPDLGYLSHIIGNYNKRTLRYEEDALPGITGLLSVLSRSFAGGFLYGLPTMFFDRALGWTPRWSHKIVCRRPECPPGLGPAGKVSYRLLLWERAWHYPFPVAEIHESVLPPCMPEQTAYLFCDTTGARLWGHLSGDYNMVTLCRRDGVTVGLLHLHSEDSLHRFPTSVTKEEAGLPVELVAIYKSRQYSKTWDEQELRYRLPLTQSDVYCVLWVEWTGESRTD